MVSIRKDRILRRVEGSSWPAFLLVLFVVGALSFIVELQLNRFHSDEDGDANELVPVVKPGRMASPPENEVISYMSLPAVFPTVSTPLSPVVLEFETCSGFVEQFIELAKALIVGLSLGAQIVLRLPKDSNQTMSNDFMGNLWEILQLEALLETSQSVFRRVSCESPIGPRRSFWCAPGPPVPAIVFLDSDGSGRERVEVEDPNDLSKVSRDLWQHEGYHLVFVNCKALSSLKVVEPSVRWDLFWKFTEGFVFNQDVLQTVSRILRFVPNYAPVAREQAASMGFPPKADAVFNVLHLRAEPDWDEFCSGFRTYGTRNNCMNNTLEIANVLLSEGVSPSVPLYVATGLSKSQLKYWRRSGSSSTGTYFKAYTILTRDMLSEKMSHWAPASRRHGMFWPAISFLLSIHSEVFVGNSVSTFSAFVMQKRLQFRRQSIAYNGGLTPLQASKRLAPKVKLRLQTFRKPIKWVFCIHPRKGEEGQANSHSLNMAKAAIHSALRSTSLVPVGVTTADPTSKFAATLVSMGVRLLYHQPSWVNQMMALFAEWTATEKKHRPSSPSESSHAILEKFLRIDIPILGLLDSFVLYTDIAVLFQADVTWQRLLHSNFEKFRRTDFESGKRHFAEAGEEGLPAFFALAREKDPMDSEKEKDSVSAGVVMINMESMKDIYSVFLSFLFQRIRHNGLEDSASLWTSFPDGKASIASFLPYEFSWKAHWPSNPNAPVVHFSGPKCESDILPFVQYGHVNSQVFEASLKSCVTTGCRELCDLYVRYQN